MNKEFHQLAPVLALEQMPESFQAFFIADGFTAEDLKTGADLPDLVDKDNITQDAEIHHAHSYKLQEVAGQLKWTDGDVLERLKGLCADAHDFKAEKNAAMVRYCLAKMTHYRVDALTYPHLFHGRPWSIYHHKFEADLGKFLVRNHANIGQLVFSAYKDIYKDCRKTAVEAWYVGRDVVAVFEKGEKLSDDQMLAICRTCIQGIGDLWTTLKQEMKL